MNRRELLGCGAAVFAGGWGAAPTTPHILALRIHSLQLQLAPGIVVPVLGCNGSSTGPVVRVKPNEAIAVDVLNDSDRRVSITGAGIHQDTSLEAGARAHIAFHAAESTFRCAQIASTCSGTLSSIRGVAGMFVHGDALDSPDPLHRLTVHHWLPTATTGSGARLGPGLTYQYATFGDRLLQASDPIRVREGQRLRFQFFNASPSRGVTLSLPEHRFRLVALDGYAVAKPAEVRHLALGPGERAEATVAMNSPGRYVLGSVDRRDRDAGFGRIVEYANARGAPVHSTIESPAWDYGSLSDRRVATSADFTLLSVLLTSDRHSQQRFQRLQLDSGRRYRLGIVNATGERPCIALRGHAFQLMNFAGTAAPGLVKDTLALPTFARTEIEFVATAPVVDLLHDPNIAVTL